MTDTSPIVSPVDATTGAWLADHREALNSRLERLRQRFPKVSPVDVLNGVASHLPAHAAVVDPVAGEPVLMATFDLIALHAARGTLAFPPAPPLWRILWGKGGASAHHDFVIFQEMPPGPVKKNPPQIDIKKQLFSNFFTSI